MSRLLHTHELNIDESDSPLAFTTTGDENWPVWERYLELDGKPAYEIGNICSTCAFFFERKGGANKKVEVTELVARLAEGIDPGDLNTIQTLATMAPAGKYAVHVLEITPSAVELGAAGDYFVTEQQAVWGQDGFWGLPHHPKVPYYRGGDRSVSPSARLFEFFMPMYPRNWLNPEQISKYREALTEGKKPTAVSLSVLDVKAPATGFAEEDTHWCLAHYILDGHHKIEAAAQTGKPITLIAFVTLEHSVCEDDQLTQLPTLLDFRTLQTTQIPY